jgi:cbb3-type cytochrome oxidase maturation protein
MDVLYLLIPLSVLAMLGILAVFAWALQAGQFDEIEAEGARILEPEDALLDAGQTVAGGPPQK